MTWEEDIRRQDDATPWSHVAATLIGWLGLIGFVLACGVVCGWVR